MDASYIHEDINDAKFQLAIKVVLNHEGGYTHDKNDPGGATNFGISLRFLKAAGIDIDLDGDIDEQDIKALDKARAEKIYKIKFWDPHKLHLIQSTLISTKLFDLGVNMGMKQAIKLLQVAINRTNHASFTVDGILGKITLANINCTNPEKLLEEYRIVAEHFYTNLVADHPELKGFLRGWINRARY